MKSKDNDKGSRLKIKKHEGTSLQQRQRPRSQELNKKAISFDLMKECHNELTSGEIVSLKNIESNEKLVPSCFVIFDLELLSLSFDFVFSSEIFKSLSFCLDRLCHLAILFHDQHAHTVHHLESLLTISLDRLDIFEGRSFILEFVRKSLSLILELS
ncbi:hypothetical protein Tco_1081191 [Tanacetum coccineum]|uniref:Uncharacterized protein n=1 Tax=Tanacetum coccineum TaxID=301880 RepID=A0ABQ5HX08_9ASTR